MQATIAQLLLVTFLAVLEIQNPITASVALYLTVAVTMVSVPIWALNEACAPNGDVSAGKRSLLFWLRTIAFWSFVNFAFLINVVDHIE